MSLLCSTEEKRGAWITVVEPGTPCSSLPSIAYGLVDHVPWFTPSRCRQCKNLAPEL